jgi:SAM-dependent methyltransferase
MTTFSPAGLDRAGQPLSEAVRSGHYAKKQILCKDWLISWSHRSRFNLGLRLARRFSGKKILDYGCGDGTFLAMLMATTEAPAAAVGCEIAVDLVRDCEVRLGDQAGLKFVMIDQLEQFSNSFDAIICMEVLEHVIDVEPVLLRFANLLAPGGTLLISVPVESGLPLIVKQVARRIAGWRGLGDYPGMSPYILSELWKGVFAGHRQHILRPIHGSADGGWSHDHKGFNWKLLLSKLSGHFQLEQIIGSPLSLLPPSLGSQVWFVMKVR